LKADQQAKSVLTNHRPSYIVILVMLRALALSINSKLWAAFMVNSLLKVTRLWTWVILTGRAVSGKAPVFRRFEVTSARAAMVAQNPSLAPGFPLARE
jgi:hypothetical protein